MRVVAERAAATQHLAVPVASVQAVNSRIPVAELLAMTGAAQLMGLAESNLGPIGQDQFVEIVFGVAVKTPSPPFAVVEAVLRSVVLRQLPRLRVDVTSLVLVALGARKGRLEGRAALELDRALLLLVLDGWLVLG